MRLLTTLRISEKIKWSYRKQNGHPEAKQQQILESNAGHQRFR
jgi:hypothetical protein